MLLSWQCNFIEKNIRKTPSGTDIVLSTAKWQFALVYLDDIVIFLESPEDQWDHMQKFHTFLTDVGVEL